MRGRVQKGGRSLLSVSANNSNWWVSRQITLGVGVLHPRRGAGKVVAFNEDEGRVHVQYATAAEGTHRYNEQSWLKFFSAVSVYSQFEDAAKAPRRRPQSVRRSAVGVTTRAQITLGLARKSAEMLKKKKKKRRRSGSRGSAAAISPPRVEHTWWMPLQIKLGLGVLHPRRGAGFLYFFIISYN